jgi:hypothetical protein
MFDNIKDTVVTFKAKAIQCWRSRTMRFSMLLMIAGVVQSALPNFAKLVSPTVFGITVMVIGMIVGMLRIITTMPLSEK